MSKPYATAEVTCRDGKVRTFVANTDGECFHYQGKKHVYIIWDEPEGRGFIVMVPCLDSGGDRSYSLAPSKFQPAKIEATTWAGKWKWEVCDE
jgi:hypothetical protein